MDKDEQIRLLKNGNTLLISALMDMVNQFFYTDIYTDKDGILTHSFMSAEEGAIEVLIDAGMAEEVDKGYKLLWDKINARIKETENG